MRIAVVGRGNVGGSLADRWERAGHEVVRIGREGGDVSSADVVFLAVPPAAIADALAQVSAVEGKTVVDATNHVRGERPDFPSLAHQVKSITGGPVAKALNLNYAALYDRIDDQPERPGALFAADDEAREVTEQLIRDAGLEPVYGGSLDNARALEDFLAVLFSYGRGFYRFWIP